MASSIGGGEVMFICAERYRLELHWTTVIYEREGIAILEGAYFSGPVLKISQRINEKDFISLDMTEQYNIIIPDYYIAKFMWNGIDYGQNIILLKKTMLENKYVNSIPKLKGSDYFVIDTSKHEESTHAFHLTYTSYLVNENGELYNF